MDYKQEKESRKISNPLKLEWPQISAEDDTKVLTTLKSIFEKYRNSLRCLKKSKSAAPAEKLTEDEEKQKKVFKSWMVLGANSVMKGLETDSLSLVLMCRKAQPALLKAAILSLVVGHQCPAVCLSDLLSAIKPSWPGLSSLTVMGIKKTPDTNDFIELVQYVKSTVLQPDVVELPQLTPSADDELTGDNEDGAVQTTEEKCTEDRSRSSEDSGGVDENQTEDNRIRDSEELVVDPTKYYVYKSKQTSDKTFSGQDFLGFEKEASADVYVNVINGKVDVFRDLGDSGCFGIAPPICSIVVSDDRTKDNHQRKRPADCSNYKGMRIKQAKRDMLTAKQKRKQEKREEKKQKKNTKQQKEKLKKVK